MATGSRSSISSAAATHPSAPLAGRQAAGHRRADATLAAHHRHRQIQILRGERGGARSQRRRDRHRRGAAREPHRSDAAAGSIDFIDPKKFTYLPNTAGCFTAEDAVRTLRLAREAGGWTLVKLEVLGDKKTLYPDMIETLRATEMLISEGFQVMVYCSDDPLMAKRLEDVGAAAIMPLAAPIGSGLGIQNPVNIRMIVEQAKVPVIVDAGVGTASDAAVAMELGCDAVLMNTAIAEAKNPVMMARAMKPRGGSGTARLSRRPHAEEALCRSVEPASPHPRAGMHHPIHDKGRRAVDARLHGQLAGSDRRSDLRILHVGVELGEIHPHLLRVRPSGEWWRPPAPFGHQREIKRKIFPADGAPRAPPGRRPSNPAPSQATQ